MDFQQLRLVFRVGKIFAITPPSLEIKNQTTNQKYYSCFMIVFYTVGVLVSSYYRKPYYIQHIHIKLAIQIILDSSLYAFNIYTVLIALNKRSQWFILIKNFKITQEESENINEKSHLLKFAFSNFIFLGILLHMTYKFASLIGVDFFKMYTIQYVQIYAQFLHNFLIYTVLNMLRVRYRAVTLALSKEVCLVTKLERRSVASFLNKIKYNVCILKENVDIFNNIFGWPNLLIILSGSLQILLSFDNIFQESLIGDFERIVGNIVIIFLSCVSGVILFYIFLIIILVRCNFQYSVGRFDSARS
ncbi:hypothetical protein BDFB_014094 [Asbolus verrucosus]|uniref:Gustatory receptor n=1 Tax=Asbolus verrucosus TaxID=1661398 RepID=A0A482VFE6_ASBVE|nr:hypothetical protein BDFB_014094 [Asbolus verrucosus]